MRIKQLLPLFNKEVDIPRDIWNEVDDLYSRIKPDSIPGQLLINYQLRLKAQYLTRQIIEKYVECVENYESKHNKIKQLIVLCRTPQAVSTLNRRKSEIMQHLSTY